MPVIIVAARRVAGVIVRGRAVSVIEAYVSERSGGHVALALVSDKRGGNCALVVVLYSVLEAQQPQKLRLHHVLVGRPEGSFRAIVDERRVVIRTRVGYAFRSNSGSSSGSGDGVRCIWAEGRVNLSNAKFIT